MGLLSWVSRKARRGVGPVKPVGARTSVQQRLRARFDAAQNTPENRRHWANADLLASEAAADPGTRAILRSRGRYEQHNNPYTDGMVQTLASDCIGRGAGLQMQTGTDAIDSLIEQEFALWAKKVKLAARLRLAIETRAAGGEMFLLLTHNPKLDMPVKLDLRPLEGDQVHTPELPLMQAGGRRANEYTDGIEFDAWGNPTFYHVLQQHPGDTRFLTTPTEYERVPAEDVIHFFKIRRPGQRRGIPQITSALSLSADRRGFRNSVLQAARKAAELGAILLETEAPADVDPGNGPEPFETMELESGMMTTLPEGAKASQMQPAQPSTTYGEFDDRLINEGSRGILMPFNVAAGNSSKYNYASGRLDHQVYDRILDIDHQDVELDALDKILQRWLMEAMLVPGYLPYATRYRVGGVTASRIPHTWLWGNRGHVDPTKDSNAQQTRLVSLTTTLEDEWAKDGRDPEQMWKKLEAQTERLKKLGLTIGQAAAMANPNAATTQPTDKPDPEDVDPEDDPEEVDAASARANGTVHANGVNGHGRNGVMRAGLM